MKPNLSRRQFLVHSAGIAGASIGLSKGRASSGEGPQQLGLGFIGVGDRGRHLLGALRQLQNLADGAPPVDPPPVHTVALCDVDPSQLKRAMDLVASPPGGKGKTPKGRVKGFTNYRALLDCPEVDAVFIATPVHLHAQQALASLLAGKSVYCEKPMAHDAEECRQVLEAAEAGEKSGQVFQVGLQRRYSPRYRRSISYLHEGEAGRVLFMRAQWHTSANPAKAKPWLYRSEKSGDMVLEQACHQFDIFNWVFQATPLRACGFGGTNRYVQEPPGRNTMDHYGAVLEYPGGAKVHLSHLSFAVPERRFSGIYELAFGERAGVDLAHALAWDGAGQTLQLATEPGNETRLAVESFISAVFTGNRPEASAKVGHDATLAALLCQRALETGRTVNWEELRGC